MTQSVFGARDLGLFSCYEEAYHRLISDLVHQQTASTQLVLGDGFVKNIFVDGGFSKNPVYMHLLAAAFPSIKVFAATIAQASAIGAALAIHKYWNSVPVNKTIIQLQPYN
jgi:sugar (pentulose or hexulose) kinase